MIDEELWLKHIEEYPQIKSWSEEKREGARRGFKSGLAEGRKMRWHDLRKDPNDLPTLDGMYWTYNEWGYYDIHKWDSQLWKECKIIAWCELPKFEE